MTAWVLDSPLKPSRWQQGLIVASYVLAGVAIAIAYLPLSIKGMIAVMVLALAGMSWRTLTRQQPTAVVAIYSDDDHWFITLKNGQRLRLNLKSWAVWRYLVVLELHSNSLKLSYRVIIFPDSLNSMSYRRLQARLRLAEPRRLASVFSQDV